jgi:hypothetical protein
VGYVDDLGSGGGPQDYGLADTDEFVGQAVVAEERDNGRVGTGVLGHGGLPRGG